MPERRSRRDAGTLGGLTDGNIFSTPFLDDCDCCRNKFIDKVAVVVGPVASRLLVLSFSIGLWVAPNWDVITDYFIAPE